MEGYTARTVVGGLSRSAIVTDPDDPEYLGPIPIPMGDVVLFFRAGCELCEHVRAILRARGLAWREVDALSGSHMVRWEQLLYTGYLRTPSVCAGGYAVVGFDAPRIHEIIDLHVERLERLREKAETSEALNPSEPVNTAAPVNILEPI